MHAASGFSFGEVIPCLCAGYMKTAPIPSDHLLRQQAVNYDLGVIRQSEGPGQC